jgi:hypothetical protein
LPKLRLKSYIYYQEPVNQDIRLNIWRLNGMASGAFMIRHPEDLFDAIGLSGKGFSG